MAKAARSRLRIAPELTFCFTRELRRDKTKKRRSNAERIAKRLAEALKAYRVFVLIAAMCHLSQFEHQSGTKVIRLSVDWTSLLSRQPRGVIAKIWARINPLWRQKVVGEFVRLDPRNSFPGLAESVNNERKAFCVVIWIRSTGGGGGGGWWGPGPIVLERNWCKTMICNQKVSVLETDTLFFNFRTDPEQPKSAQIYLHA